MAAIASRARTGFVIAAATATALTGLVLKAPAKRSSTPAGRTSGILHVALESKAIQQGPHDLVVTITMPPDEEPTRVPVSVAVVLDRSGSMTGVPLANAKTAAKSLVDKLEPTDAFSIVTYSDRDQVITHMTKATAEAKRAAKLAIDDITADGGTCTSCGLTRGETELAQTPVPGAHRVILISDGQANEGVWDRDALVDLVRGIASHGDSVSAVGVGLDFDEQTMMRIADNGRGNYHFVDDTDRLAAMFATELHTLQNTVATNVKLAIDEHQMRADRAYTYGELVRFEGQGIVLPLADMHAGESRKLVVHGVVTGEDVGTFRLTWENPVTHARQNAIVDLATKLTTDPAKVAATADPLAQGAIAEVRTADALDSASNAVEHDNLAQAQGAIRDQIRKVEHIHISEHDKAQAMEKLVSAQRRLDELKDSAGNAAYAQKELRTNAYELRR
ncbi:MAG: VWA domain-containing protein [Kofleriaceae bacterium]